MEASVFEVPAGLAHRRVALASPLLRLRSDEQLVALFRRGNDEAFRVIYERYHKRLLAYARQMLLYRQDAEEALQDVFVRAYFGLRAHDRDLALRAWLFRVAHNRCIDELRRPVPPPTEIAEMLRSPVSDPAVEFESRESLRRLIADVRRLPDQQRSALLMRELDGMPYEQLAASLGVTVPAVKSLLVRARVGLTRAAEARDTACSEIREELVGAHDHGVRPNALARRHMHDCSACRSFRRDLRGMSRELAALAPALGPLGVLMRLWAGSGGAGRFTTDGTGASGGTASSVGSAVGAGGTVSSAGVAMGVNHLAALLAAAAATGGAVEIRHTLTTPPTTPSQVTAVHPWQSGSGAARARPAEIYAPSGGAAQVTAGAASPAPAPASPGSVSTLPQAPASPSKPATKTKHTSIIAPQTLVLPGPPPSTPSSSTQSSSAGASGSTSSLGTATLTSTGGQSASGGSQGNANGSGSSSSSPSGSSSSAASSSSGSTSSGSTSSTSPSTTSSSTSASPTQSGSGAHDSAPGTSTTPATGK